MHTPRSIAFALAISGFAFAQNASIIYYGPTCGPQPPGGSPMIQVIGLPRLGQPVSVSQVGVQVQVQPSCRHHGSMFLLMGVSRTFGWGTSLPFLVPNSLTENHPCLVWTSGDFIGPQISISDARYFVIPNDPQLIGVHLYLQLFVYYRNDGAFCYPFYQRWMTSNCADLLIGT
jgi:hypothetical protein